ncbi:MAG TPA: hypothetical protein VMV94_15975 [Phycisphaerae bacterium]|nr:hypothetical protein [Phycisphaerae bacterium]
MLMHPYRRPRLNLAGWSMVKWLAVAISGLSTTTLGCSANKASCQPSVEAESKYQTICEREEEIVAIEASDLGVSPAEITEVGQKNLVTEPSTGRFPTGLSVVCVEAATRGDEPEHFLRPVSVEEYRGARWIRATQDLPVLREVTMLGTYGLDPRGTDWQALLRASLRLDCDLCLIYGEVYETEADAEFVGVLWDARTAQALATYRAPMVLPADVRLTYEEKKEYVGLRVEAEQQAMAELQRMVRDTIWDLAAKDNEATTQPSPWQTDLPLYPRDLHRTLRIFTKEKPQH